MATAWLIGTVPPAGAQEPGELSISIRPGVSVPLPISIGGLTKNYYQLGWGVGVYGMYLLPPVPFMAVGGGLTYVSASTNPAVTNTSFGFSYLGLTASIGAQVEVLPGLNVGIQAVPGWYLLLTEAGIQNGPRFGGQAAVTFSFNKSFSLGITGGYDNHWSFTLGGPAHHGFSAGLEARITFARSRESKLRYDEIRLRPVFPVFQTYYNANPVGEIVVTNGERVAVRDVKVQFHVPQFMDAEKTCATIPEMKPGEKRTVPLYALFNDKILEVTEGTRSMATVRTEYRYRDETRIGQRSEPIEIKGRNAMTWDDDWKAASFVTTKDQAVLRYAKGVAGAVRDVPAGSIPEGFRTALARFESMSLYGIRYVKDPTTPYEELSKQELSKQEQATDFLQFPVETLTYKAGDCDDLSILFCALLESVSVEAAFITVPGHIFVAFSTGMDAAEAKAMFSSLDDLIAMGEKLWVPVEITAITDGFLKAWQTGAREWRDAAADKSAGFYPVREAWRTYGPVGLVAGQSAVAAPDPNTVTGVYRSVLRSFVQREVGPRAEKLRAGMARSEGDLRLVNKLGLLYAKYGLYDEATREFRNALEAKEYVPILVNLGNIAFLQKDAKQAAGYYERAVRSDSANAVAVLGLARAKYELEDRAGARELYLKLRDLSSELASKNQYLVAGSTDTTRAGTADQTLLAWAED